MKSEENGSKNDQILQWHPAFFAGIQIELEEDVDCLEFTQEYSLGRKPMEMDVLIKKEEKRILKKSIGKIFRRYNVIEYKSPNDYLSIDDYYKTYAYTYFYKSDRSPVDSVKIGELTVSLVSESCPRKLLEHLKTKRGFQIQEKYPGIYYVVGDIFPTQIVVTSNLSRKESLWLRNLTNKIKSEEETEELLCEYQKHYDNKLYASVMNIIVRANEERFEEAKKMCEALRELMRDELKAERLAGEEQVNKLILKLSEQIAWRIL